MRNHSCLSDSSDIPVVVIDNSSYTIVDVSTIVVASVSECALKHIVFRISKHQIPVVSVCRALFYEICCHVISLECELAWLCIEKCSVLKKEILDSRIVVVDEVREADM